MLSSLSDHCQPLLDFAFAASNYHYHAHRYNGWPGTLSLFCSLPRIPSLCESQDISPPGPCGNIGSLPSRTLRLGTRQAFNSPNVVVSLAAPRKSRRQVSASPKLLSTITILVFATTSEGMEQCRLVCLKSAAPF